MGLLRSSVEFFVKLTLRLWHFRSRVDGYFVCLPPHIYVYRRLWSSCVAYDFIFIIISYTRRLLCALRNSITLIFIYRYFLPAFVCVVRRTHLLIMSVRRVAVRVCRVGIRSGPERASKILNSSSSQYPARSIDRVVSFSCCIFYYML